MNKFLLSLLVVVTVSVAVPASAHTIPCLFDSACCLNDSIRDCSRLPRWPQCLETEAHSWHCCLPRGLVRCPYVY